MLNISLQQNLRKKIQNWHFYPYI